MTNHRLAKYLRGVTELDAIDALLSDWARERPDLEFASMALFARLNRFVGLSNRRLEAHFQRHGISTGEFDVLAALRRAGAPYALKPSVLARAVMLTAAGMTGRLDKLEDQGLVARLSNPDDRRSAPVALTKAGIRLVDKLVAGHLANEDDLFAAISGSQRAQFDRVLRTLLAALESAPTA